MLAINHIWLRNKSVIWWWTQTVSSRIFKAPMWALSSSSMNTVEQPPISLTGSASTQPALMKPDLQYQLSVFASFLQVPDQTKHSYPLSMSSQSGKKTALGYRKEDEKEQTTIAGNWHVAGSTTTKERICVTPTLSLPFHVLASGSCIKSGYNEW